MPKSMKHAVSFKYSVRGFETLKQVRSYPKFFYVWSVVDHSSYLSSLFFSDEKSSYVWGSGKHCWNSSYDLSPSRSQRLYLAFIKLMHRRPQLRFTVSQAQNLQSVSRIDAGKVRWLFLSHFWVLTNFWMEHYFWG